MALQFFNTLTSEKAEFQSLQDGLVKMYTCGPTVYDYAHIGNFRAYVFEDLLRRYLKYKGYRVIQVMNLTDIDDKTIAGALDKKISLNEYTEPYIKAFFEDLDALNIERAEHYPRATEYIAEMIDLVKTLIDKGYAYESGGSVYYRISTFSEYGKLSHKKIDQNIAGSRVDHDEYERDDIRDFVLWKKKKEGEPGWQSPWGEGRPGWHIECSAMSIKLLGESFDIHTGGEDNIFPHHENEIAQSEGATGKEFVKYWLHCKFLLVNNEKMSKSKGNFYTLRDLIEKGYKKEAIRYLLLSHNYRHPLNLTFEGLQGAESSVSRMREFVRTVSRLPETTAGADVTTDLETVKRLFEEALDDDLNIAKALAAIFDFISNVNKKLHATGLSSEAKENIVTCMCAFDSVLGVMHDEEKTVPAEIISLAEARRDAKQAKDFERADQLRDEINEKGWFIKDLPGGEFTLDEK